MAVNLLPSRNLSVFVVSLDQRVYLWYSDVEQRLLDLVKAVTMGQNLRCSACSDKTLSCILPSLKKSHYQYESGQGSCYVTLLVTHSPSPSFRFFFWSNSCHVKLPANTRTFTKLSQRSTCGTRSAQCILNAGSLILRLLRQIQPYLKQLARIITCH